MFSTLKHAIIAKLILLIDRFMSFLLKCSTAHISQKYYSKIGRLDSGPNATTVSVVACSPGETKRLHIEAQAHPATHTLYSKIGKYIWNHKHNQGSNIVLLSLASENRLP